MTADERSGIARICHAYSLTPQQVLDMPYSHFQLLSESVDECERSRGRYFALAFHDPEKLFKENHRQVITPEQDRKTMNILKGIAKGGRVT